MPKLSVSDITTYNWTFEQDILNYPKHGIEGVGVFRDKLDNYGVDKGIALLEQSPLQVANLVGAGFFLSNPASTRAQIKYGIQDTLEAIELAQRLKTEVILMLTGTANTFFQTQATAEELVVTALKEVAPVARAAGVKLAIEPIHPKYDGFTFLRTIPQTMDIIERVGEENVGLMFDTYHLWETDDLIKNIAVAGDRIFSVHINDEEKDYAPGNDRTIMGRGIIPLSEILDAIADTGYDGFYDVEIMSGEIWAMDYHEVLAECRRSFDALMA
ncbi:MAG: sugar phosphate isomerase/epimerase [Caldilineales bacterium]|nr:sugar phosphate isomerase/epimerase [Caldilineales bacterium]